MFGTMFFVLPAKINDFNLISYKNVRYQEPYDALSRERKKKEKKIERKINK